MPRRIPDYSDAYFFWNYISTLGSYLTSVSILLFFVIILITLVTGKAAPADPWNDEIKSYNTNSLEWLLDSPPPFHCFNELPRVYNVHN